MRYNTPMPYRMTFRKQPVRALRRMPAAQSQRIMAALDSLAEAPNRQDVDVAPLTGQHGFRLRVGGIRVIFERYDTERHIEVLRIAPRGDAYRA